MADVVVGDTEICELKSVGPRVVVTVAIRRGGNDSIDSPGAL